MPSMPPTSPSARRCRRNRRRFLPDRRRVRESRSISREIPGMAATSDTLPTATRVTDPGIRALYRQENCWQAWLDVEAALARAQAQLGIIPADAAEAIAAKSKLELMDRARIDEGF